MMNIQKFNKQTFQYKQQKPVKIIIKDQFKISIYMINQ